MYVVCNALGDQTILLDYWKWMTKKGHFVHRAKKINFGSEKTRVLKVVWNDASCYSNMLFWFITNNAGSRASYKNISFWIYSKNYNL